MVKLGHVKLEVYYNNWESFNQKCNGTRRSHLRQGSKGKNSYMKDLVEHLKEYCLIALTLYLLKSKIFSTPMFISIFPSSHRTWVYSLHCSSFHIKKPSKNALHHYFPLWKRIKKKETEMINAMPKDDDEDCCDWCLHYCVLRHV